MIKKNPKKTFLQDCLVGGNQMKKSNLENSRTVLIILAILMTVLGVVLPFLLNDVFMGITWIFIGLISICSSFFNPKDGKHPSMFHIFLGIVQIIFGVWFFLR